MTIANRLITEWAGGFVSVSDSASITAYGEQEGTLDLSAIGDIDIVDQIAADNMTITGAAIETIVATIEDVDPASGHSTYVDFGLGDSVTAPGRVSGTQTIRCASITVGLTGDELEVTTEWGTARDLAEERVKRSLTRSSNGTLDGRSPSPVVSVTSPSIITSQVITPEPVSLASDGSYAVEVGDKASGTAVKQRGWFYMIRANCQAAGVGDTEFDVTINGSTHVTFTFPADDAEAEYHLDLGDVVILEVADIVNIECTTAGGHEGVNVRLMTSPLGI